MMAKQPKKNKVRAVFRKKHESRTRHHDLTREFHAHGFENDETERGERVTGKGKLTRKRTIVGETVEGEEAGLGVRFDIDETDCKTGRVLSVHGLTSKVETDLGEIYNCSVSGLLKSLYTDQRHVIAAGDVVLFRPEGTDAGLIVRIEPRHGVLCRNSKGRQHVIVSNVDQILIVASVAEPVLKPNLIDRILVTAEKSRIRPVICLNKVDLVDLANLQPLMGVYGQMGYQVLALSAETEFGMDELREVVQGQQSVVVGQSGVGKSSLLNAIEPGLHLRVNTVSAESQKGRHTTTTGRLISLVDGGYVVDTPGIRQFQLWDVIPVEVAGFYRDVRPYVSLCRFPDCTHTHEDDCAVKNAVADGHLDARRYESYCHLLEP